MSESELHAILNEIKNKGQVSNDDASNDTKQYVEIIEAFSPVTTDSAVDAFSAQRESKKGTSKKHGFFTKLIKIFV